MSFGESMRELESYEIDEVSGGIYSAGWFLVGLGAAIVGGALTVAGLGTPVSMGGAALAAEGAAAMAIGLS
jgi:predicted phage tail protein